MKYLKITDINFVDPHGSPDHGGFTKEIVESEYYNKIYQESLLEENEELAYDNYRNKWLSDDELESSENGYNSEYHFITLKPLSNEEAEKFEEIIKQYDNIS